MTAAKITLAKRPHHPKEEALSNLAQFLDTYGLDTLSATKALADHARILECDPETLTYWSTAKLDAEGYTNEQTGEPITWFQG
jgi:hypothetical protein